MPIRFWNSLACMAALALLLPLSVQAELPPSVYEGRQKEAPEKVFIEVLRVDIGPGEKADEQKVDVMAMVLRVERSETGLKPDQIINISYVITDRPRGYVGPGEIPLLQEGESTVAFLARHESESLYLPVAGVMSFREF